MVCLRFFSAMIAACSASARRRSASRQGSEFWIQFDPDVATAEHLGDQTRRTGSKKRIKDEIADICG
jgi:hypothetical protein